MAFGLFLLEVLFEIYGSVLNKLMTVGALVLILNSEKIPRFPLFRLLSSMGIVPNSYYVDEQFFEPNLFRCLSRSAKQYQMFFLHLLRWSYGFYPLFCQCINLFIDFHMLNYLLTLGMQPTWILMNKLESPGWNQCDGGKWSLWLTSELIPWNFVEHICICVHQR